MMASLERAIAGMLEARAAEGRRLDPVLQAHLASIEQLTDKVAASAGALRRKPSRFRLKEQVV